MGDLIPAPQAVAERPLQNAQLLALPSRSSVVLHVSVSSHLTNENVRDQVVSIITSGSSAISAAITVLNVMSKHDFDLLHKPFFEHTGSAHLTWLVQPVQDILMDIAAKDAFVLSVRQILKTDQRFSALARLIRQFTQYSDPRDVTMFATSVVAIALFVSSVAAQQATLASLNVHYASSSPEMASAGNIRKRPAEPGIR